MQVNQSTSPNFGKLQIVKSPTIANVLEKQSVDNLQKIKNVGEVLKNTKFFNIVITDKNNYLVPQIESSIDAYFGTFYSKIFNDIKYSLKENTIMLDKTYGVARYKSEDGTKATYNVWNCFGNVNNIDALETLSMIALELDREAIKRYNEKTVADKAQREYEQAISKLANDVLAEFAE